MPFNHDRKTYGVKLIMDRLPNQKSVNELRLVPVPSQVDDWLLQVKVMGDDIRLREGKEEYDKWKDGETKEAEERRLWHVQQEQIIKLKELGEKRRK